MIALICKQCGGKLEAEESKVFVAGESVVILDSYGKLHCPFCGTDYMPGTMLDKAAASVFHQDGQHVKYQVNINGGQVIAVGDGITISGGLHFGKK